MLLNFGAYLKILLVCSIQGTTQPQMLADIVGTIDPDNKYNEKEKKELKHKHSVSKLATCKADFPTSWEDEAVFKMYGNICRKC